MATKVLKRKQCERSAGDRNKVMSHPRRFVAAPKPKFGGLTSSSSAPTPSTPIRRVKLIKESELRIEVGPDFSLKLRILTGTAEIFGTELCPDSWITFPPAMKFAVFTWHGATIEIDGITELDYTADETPMISYINVHAVLQARRDRAKAFSTDDLGSFQGPRVIVIGPTDSGKTSLSKMLLSWAAKQGRTPLFVDLDVDQGSITIPGCIGAIPIETPIDPVQGIPSDLVLSYYYGHLSPSTNVDLYKILLKELAKTVEALFARSVEPRATGMIINTMGWIDGVGFELLLLTIDTFNANVVLVLDEEKLCNTLKNMLKGRLNTDVVKLQKSGGVVPRNPMARSKARNFKVREYFYGPGGDDLAPHSHIAKFSDFYVFRIGTWPPAPRATLPIGPHAKGDSTRLIAESLSSNLLFQILAVSLAKEPSEILSSNVAGFIYVTDVDLLRRRFTYLAPNEIKIPNKYLIAGGVTWVDL